MSDDSASDPEPFGIGSDAESGTTAPTTSNTKLATNDHSGVFRAINSILTSKRPSQHVNPILSKRRKLVQKEAAESEIRDTKARIAANNKVLERRRMQNKDSSKPDVSRTAHEHALRKIATRGVLRLFNAIAQHQKQPGEDGDGDDNLTQKAQQKEAQKQKQQSRDMFLKLLRGNETDLSHALTGGSAKDEGEGEGEGNEGESEPTTDLTTKPTTQPKWRVLQDDLLLGPAKLKDWDAASDSSEDDEKTLRLKRKLAATTTVVPKEGGLWDGLSDSDDEEQED